MSDDSKNVEFVVSPVIKNFVYDLHQSIRRSHILPEIQKLYEVDFREITEKYFNTSPWPNTTSVASECENDEVFLYFYRELTLRHLFTKLKPQLKDFFESWENYTKIFEFLLASPNPDLALNTQWIYDLMVEFIYQFQGFCQYRGQLQSRNVEDIKILAANPTPWTYPAIWKILSGLIQKSGISGKNRPQIKPDSSVILQFGVFASIEQARLECLCGDHLTSLRVASYVDTFEHAELFNVAPFGQVNLYYHMGISQLLLRRFTDAIDTLSHVVLYITRILKPGVSHLRGNMVSTLNKTLDKILALVTIAAALNPGRRIDDQVRELIQGKFKDKAHKLVDGDMKTFADMFEAASPKFIMMGIPDYTSTPVNLNQENFNRQVQVFLKEIEQNVSVLKLRSYLRLYAAIEVSKLARFNDMTESEFESVLISFKHKAVQVDSSVGQSKAVYVSDVNYTIQDSNVMIDSSSSRFDKDKMFEKYFISGIRKNAEMIQSLRLLDKSKKA